MEAIIQQGKDQFKVKKGDEIRVDNLKDDPKKKVVIEKVLAVSEGDKHHIGTPYVKGATVEAKVTEHVKGEKVINFRYRPKKGYHRKVGHRQKFSILEILGISLGSSKKSTNEVEKKKEANVKKEEKSKKVTVKKTASKTSTKKVEKKETKPKKNVVKKATIKKTEKSPAKKTTAKKAKKES